MRCRELEDGSIRCLNGSTVGFFGDTCAFTCNDGYVLQGGPVVEECLADGSWSGENPECVAG